MQIFTEFVKIKNLSLGLGFFDGVHPAHQIVIKKTVSLAKEFGLKSAIITFKESPECALNKNSKYKYLETNEKKADIIEALGVDYLFFIDFNSVKNLKAEEYLKKTVEYFSPKFIITGFNNNFGKGAKGNPELLRVNQEKFDYKYFEIEPQMLEGKLISSSLIKDFIASGDIESANKFLGRNFSVSGVVFQGNKIGRKIKYPTANISWSDSLIKLPYGVYAGRVDICGVKYPSVINWGTRPTVDGKELIEAHIINYSGNLYGEKIEVSFEKFIRYQMKFNSFAELQKQIKLDILTSDNNIPNN